MVNLLLASFCPQRGSEATKTTKRLINKIWMYHTFTNQNSKRTKVEQPLANNINLGVNHTSIQNGYCCVRHRRYFYYHYYLDASFIYRWSFSKEIVWITISNNYTLLRFTFRKCVFVIHHNINKWQWCVVVFDILLTILSRFTRLRCVWFFLEFFVGVVSLPS